MTYFELRGVSCVMCGVIQPMGRKSDGLILDFLNGKSWNMPFVDHKCVKSFMLGAFWGLILGDNKVALLKLSVWAKEASTRIGNHYGGHSKGSFWTKWFSLEKASFDIFCNYKSDRKKKRIAFNKTNRISNIMKRDKKKILQKCCKNYYINNI